MKAVVTAAVLAILVSGCFTFRVGPESREVRLWSLGPPEGTDAPAVSEGPDLLVRDLSASLLYETRDLVAVNDSGRVILSSGDRWVSLPAQMISNILRQEIAATGAFGTVLRDVATGADLILDGRLLELGARRLEDGWYAVVRLELRLLSACDGTVLHSSRYSRRSRLDAMAYPEMAASLRLLSAGLAAEAAADLSSEAADRLLLQTE
jgi:ABC-type uncharacterized transport system auxiliary subunit